MATSNTKVFLSERLNKQIQAWCGVNSLLYTDGNLNWTPAPVSPLPKFLPRKHYDYLTKIQPIWNKLMDRVARNREFITKELEFVAKADPFTDRLLRIYDGVPEDVLQNSHQLGIFRSDYMIDEHYDAPLQIEINTVSSGFACLSQKIGNLQNYLLTRNKHDHELINIGREIYDIPAHDHFELPHSVEESQSLQKVAAAMALAHNTYHQKTAVILFIVQPFEKNQADQRGLEAELWNQFGIRCEFITLNDIYHHGRLENNQLLIRSKLTSDTYPVSVAYYRSGYTPTDYPTEEEWLAREMVENSDAVKCPSVGYHLAGAKAIQAALYKDNVLEQFIKDPEECRLLRRCFMEQYSLGDPEVKTASRKAMDDAIADGRKWVLKPQREGGGNNYYGDTVSQFLGKHYDDSILDGFVLMKRIVTGHEKAAFLKQGQFSISPSISELGIYGCSLYGHKTELLNECSGYLLRTKADGVDEGGVAAGFSVLNAITLVD